MAPSPFRAQPSSGASALLRGPPPEVVCNLIPGAHSALGLSAESQHGRCLPPVREVFSKV